MNVPFLFPPFFGFGFIFYFLPSIIALARSKRNTLSIIFISECGASGVDLPVRSP